MKLGFIGIGNMGYAMLKGAREVFPAEEITYFDVSMERMELVKKETGVAYRESSGDLLDFCDFIVLAVKPQYLPGVLPELKKGIAKEKIVISIIPGLSIEALKEALGEEIRIVRSMPNTPAMIKEGMTALCFSEDCFSKEEEKFVFRFFDSFGKYELVEERLLDAAVVTSGSTPAYVYMFIEAIADGAVKYGMPRDKAYRMAAQTVLGSAKMVLETGLHPGELKDQVCSPGGTTIAGISALEESGFRSAVIKAADQCYQKTISFQK